VNGPARSLYVHLPFCAHRCGYCDFVTVVGRVGDHHAYCGALLGELERMHSLIAEPLDTVFVGGGTPTFADLGALDALLDGLPAAGEVTVEANPETVTAALARLLRDHGVTRISLGAQSFQPHLLDVLERQAGPDDVRRAVHTLRDASFDNISLDIVYGIPGQSSTDVDSDLAEALALDPEHLSCYELEAKPGTRFTVAYGGELARQAEAMEGYFERVVRTLTTAGYRWYETSNFCVSGERAAGRDLRAQHNLAVWRGRDYVGIGVGAVSTVGDRRWRNAPSLPGYLAALARGDEPRREIEELDEPTRLAERLMLGLRLDEPLALDGLEPVIDERGLERMVARNLVEPVAPATARGGPSRLVRPTRRGRFVSDAVAVELLA
jgi:oxygen-independent coproporphyrinogen-3 oxidase